MKTGKKKPRDSAASAVQQLSDSTTETARQYGRSRVTNAAARGSILWLDHTDKRGSVPRRFRDIVLQVTNDLGGPDLLSEAQRQIVKRIASLSIWCESMECRMADGEDIDILVFGRTANSLRRLCESIGLQRVPKTVGPSLGELLRRDHQLALIEAEQC